METQAEITRRQLLDVAERLTDEYDALPAGAVLRTFAKAVVHLRHHVAPERLPGYAEDLTRALLARRAGRVRAAS